MRPLKLFISAAVVAAVLFIADPVARAQSSAPQAAPAWSGDRPGRGPGDAPELQQILDRLEKLEQVNRALAEEVRALREQIATKLASAQQQPPAGGETYLNERVAVNEQRIADLAQTKVESSQKFPIQLTGMALFNTFLNSRGTPTADKRTLNPTTAGVGSSGATLRQSILGLVYRGPDTLWGGKVHGSLYMDFYNSYNDVTSAGPSSFSYEYLTPRLRTAEIGIDWQTRSITVGQLKPLISPRQPESLALVAVPPLDNAGNLWLWLPQARFEQRVKLGENTSLTAQAAVIQTEEEWAIVSNTFAPTLGLVRPGYEGRVEFSHGRDDGPRFAIAPGFHASNTHVAGTSVPSRLFSLDGMASPWRKIEFSGSMFTGENAASLGGLSQGFRILSANNAVPVHGMGAWGQIALLPTDRLSFHFYGGRQDLRNQDLPLGAVGTGTAFAANTMYQIAPNVRLALEGGQTRLDFNGRGQRLRNYYDLALAYYF